MDGLSLRTSLRVSDDCMIRELDGEAVILNLGSSTYFGLDPVGTRIWQLIEEHGRLGVVVTAMLGEYDAPADAIERDVVRLVSELLERGLVVRSGDQT
jgi:hypothetical protein